MADITMCSGEKCPLRKKCHRHTAQINTHWQSWFTQVPYNKIKQKCEYFWDNSDKHNRDKQYEE